MRQFKSSSLFLIFILVSSVTFTNFANAQVVDTDGDGIPDNKDNCKKIANKNQSDKDGDKIGDSCDPKNDKKSDSIEKQSKSILQKNLKNANKNNVVAKAGNEIKETKTETLPNGAQESTTKYKDGTIVVEGSGLGHTWVSTSYTNGTTITIYDEGSGGYEKTSTRDSIRVRGYSNGTIVTSDDSMLIYRYPDGSRFVIYDLFKGGRTDITLADGTYRSVYGSRTDDRVAIAVDILKSSWGNNVPITNQRPNDDGVTVPKSGTSPPKNQIKTKSEKSEIANDDLKTLYKIAKLHEGASELLSSVNDQQAKILQQSTVATNKDLTKEQKTTLKLLLKEQDSDKKDIKAIQDYAKKVSNAIKKLAQKDGLKSSELDKIAKTVKSEKPQKNDPVNQLKQDATNAKNNLDEAKKFQEEIDLAKIAVQIGEILPDSEGRSNFEQRMEKRFEEQYARERELEDREREQKLAKQQEEADEKSKQHVIDMMQQLLELVQKDEQAQTGSILDTIPEPTLKDLFTPTSATQDQAKKSKQDSEDAPKKVLVKPDASKKTEKTTDEMAIIEAYSIVTSILSLPTEQSNLDILKQVKSQLTTQEYRTLVDFLDSRIEEKRSSVSIPLQNPSPITDAERAQVLAELSSAAVMPLPSFNEQKNQKPSNEKNKPDFEILLKPDSMRLPRGGYGEVDVTVKSLNGWDDKVWLDIPIPIGPIRYPSIVPNLVTPTPSSEADAAFAVDVSLFSCPGKYRMAVYGMTHDQMPMEISYTYFNLEIIDPGKIFELSTDQKAVTVQKGGSKSFALLVKNLDNTDHAYLIDTNKFKAPAGVTIEHRNTIGSTSPEQTNKGTITIKTSNSIKTPLTFTLPLRAMTALNCEPTPTEITSVTVNVVGDAIESTDQVLVPGPEIKPVQTPPSNTKPTLSLPKQVTQEATGPSGANVAFSTSSSDKEDGSLTPVCTPASGTMFPIGATSVSCTVTDSNNNSVSGSFTITVRDTTPPAFAPFQPTEGVRDDSGVQVFFDVTANDLVDGNVPVSCNYPSGYKFPPGVTELKCTTSDSRGNQSTKTVQITVTVTESGQ